MILCYLIAFIPLIVGGVLWYTRKEIVLWEWLAGGAIGFTTAGVFHLIAIQCMIADNETWSGQVVTVVHEPEWVEKYQVAIYRTETRTRTVSDGKGGTRTETYTEEVFDHYEDRYRTHPESWGASISFGARSEGREISKSRYNEIKDLFGGKIIIEKPYKIGFYSGDPNTYKTKNETGFVYPTTTWVSFENRIKAAPSVFSYPKVDPKAPVYEYPANSDGWVSNRLLGTAASIPIRVWDQMNAELGPSKKVNVILVGFASMDSGLAGLQEAKWIGGKKNDLVLCYGWDGSKVAWSRVFGWTEREDVKRNLETILLQNRVDVSIIPKLQQEINKNYRIKDWSKFDYISVEPPTWAYLLILIMVVTQIGYYCFAFSNGEDKRG